MNPQTSQNPSLNPMSTPPVEPPLVATPTVAATPVAPAPVEDVPADGLSANAASTTVPSRSSNVGLPTNNNLQVPIPNAPQATEQKKPSSLGLSKNAVAATVLAAILFVVLTVIAYIAFSKQ